LLISLKIFSMKFSKIFLFLIIPLFAFTAHKYYISLCQIEYIEKQQSVQITIGFFIDDIEFTLNKEHNTKLNIATKKENPNIDKYYLDYLNKNLKISINNKPQIYQYIGKEYDGDLVRFYLEITNIQQLKSIEIINTCLFSDFDDQENIVKIKANNTHKTFYLKKANDKGLLKL